MGGAAGGIKKEFGKLTGTKDAKRILGGLQEELGGTAGEFDIYQRTKLTPEQEAALKKQLEELGKRDESGKLIPQFGREATQLGRAGQVTATLASGKQPRGVAQGEVGRISPTQTIQAPTIASTAPIEAATVAPTREITAQQADLTEQQSLRQRQLAREEGLQQEAATGRESATAQVEKALEGATPEERERFFQENIASKLEEAAGERRKDIGRRFSSGFFGSDRLSLDVASEKQFAEALASERSKFAVEQAERDRQARLAGAGQLTDIAGQAGTLGTAATQAQTQVLGQEAGLESANIQAGLSADIAGLSEEAQTQRLQANLEQQALQRQAELGQQRNIEQARLEETAGITGAQLRSTESIRSAELEQDASFRNAGIRETASESALNRSYNLALENAKAQREIDQFNTQIQLQENISQAGFDESAGSSNQQALLQQQQFIQQLLSIPAIENIVKNIAPTPGLGQTAAQGAGQGLGQALGTLAGTALSDVKLKTNISRTGKLAEGINLYEWTWNRSHPNKNEVGKKSRGVIAQEVASRHPECVFYGVDGFLRVDYLRLENKTNSKIDRGE